MSSPLPNPYGWLPLVVGLPRMVQEALALHGEKECPGPGDNPNILAWAREVGLEKVYRHDETAWCGLFMAVVAQRAGKPVPDGPLWALNWRHFGVPAVRPLLGDVLVLSRDGGGHVCLYVGEDAEAWHGLGGNTRDSVSIARFAKTRTVAVRRPAYKVPPAGARQVLLSSAGSLSTNEA